ncbi:MAG: DUF6586 family protein [Pseudomonadales bacterium]
MANAQRPIVIQRLYFCRLHLEWWSAELARQETPKAIIEQSLGESTLFHLVMAYRAYLQEIATAYTVPAIDYVNAGDLIATLSAQGYDSAEARELAALEVGMGWLAGLLTQYSALGPLRGPTAVSSLQVISASQVNNTDPIGLEDCRDYFQALSEIIDNQRTRLEEW